LENIRDIRAQSDARFYREQFQLPAEWEQRWLTLSYIVDSKHKILHLIAETADALRELDETLRQLHAVRKSLMSGLGESALRQAVWERQYWTASDQEKDEKLVFEEVEGLCKRLGMAHNREDLLRIFKVCIPSSQTFSF
jgi:phosphatidylinositol phospholipase C delta